MSQEDGQADLGAAAAARMPPPYCEGPWKTWVAGFVLLAFVTLSFTIEEHFRVAVQNTTPVAALPPPPVGASLGGVLTENAVVPVAATRAWVDGTDPNLRLVAGRSRTAFNDAAASIRPSVVGVRAALVPTQAGRASVERVGSGVVVESSGYTLTCDHVVAGATSIFLSGFDQSPNQLPAVVVAAEGDLALLKPQVDISLKSAAFADSDQVQVGDWVLAVGYPFGLGLTVTSGIVGRRHGVLSIPGGPQYTELLQTDAPINEGSSGGPLVNLSGEVIGLNTAIYAPTGVFSGAGFAIPSKRLRQFLARHLPKTVEPAPALNSIWGMSVAELGPAQQMQFPSGGVVVLGVEPNSPASLIRVAPGDVIVNVAAQSVRDTNTLRQVQAQLQSQLDAGASVQMQVWRQGQMYSLTLSAPTNRFAG